MTWRILEGDCREHLATLDAGSVQTCVTSPPYFGLRDYGTGEWEGGDPACDHRHETNHQVQGVTSARVGRSNADAQRNETFRGVCGKCGGRRIDRQIGLEPTPDEFVAALVAVFREVRRVLRDDGTVWLNLGDSYGRGFGGGTPGTKSATNAGSFTGREYRGAIPGIKDKDLVGIPWMVAFALRADGWYLRSDIIWAKPNPMPESVTDRPTKAHEYLFLLSKGPRYFYDADAIREDGAEPDRQRADRIGGANGHTVRHSEGAVMGASSTRNRRSVWTIATQPYPGAHFATFPPKLIEPCILAGTSPKACGVCGAPWQRVVERTAMVVKPTPKREKWQAEDDHARTQVGGTMVEPPTSRTVGWESSCEHDDDTGRCVVLDPFTGAGTTGVVCGWHGRDFVGIELNPEYAQMARDRVTAEGKPWRPKSDPPKVHDDQLGLLG